MRTLGSFKSPIKDGWIVFGLQFTVLVAAVALGIDGFVNTDGDQVLLVCIILAAVTATLIATASGRMSVRRRHARRTGPSAIDFAEIWPLLSQAQEPVEFRVMRRRVQAPARKRKTGNDQ